MSKSLEFVWECQCTCGMALEVLKVGEREKIVIMFPCARCVQDGEEAFEDGLAEGMRLR